MIDGARISKRLEELGLSQSELARRLGVSQQTIHKLIVGKSRGSVHLHRIARELLTTVDYLTGQVDDPAENAPAAPPEPDFQTITLDVILPSKPALVQMFAGILAASEGMTADELAHELAEHLPTGLALARSARPSLNRYRGAKTPKDPEAGHGAVQSAGRP